MKKLLAHLSMVITLLAFAAVPSSCAALNTGKLIVHNVNEVAQALCAAYEAEVLKRPVDDPKVTAFCAIESNFAPFIATITAKQQEARAGVPLKTAALPDQCAEPPASSAAPTGDAGATGAPPASSGRPRAVRPAP